ncbi:MULTISPECIES: DinB family protein [unclassified Nocardioides]|uniref:DinB family protein n=1 Tax=unclassified Nocardioides TaxID=2615069 RepID=UPI001E3B78D8|nr:MULTISPECIES: DinB family protein [unclassified Nocardioides]
MDEEQLRGATIRDVDLSGTRFVGVVAEHLEITGEFDRLEVNGVDVVPLVTAELDRRHPERARLRPTTVAGYQEAFTLLEQLWSDTVDRARGLDAALLHERVDDEWSFTDTLRHLVFATESWIGRVVQGVPSPWHPLSLPWEQMPPTPASPPTATRGPVSTRWWRCGPRDSPGSTRRSTGSPTTPSPRSARSPRDPGGRRRGSRSRSRTPSTS